MVHVLATAEKQTPTAIRNPLLIAMVVDQQPIIRGFLDRLMVALIVR
jgi:hypothetical protein